MKASELERMILSRTDNRVRNLRVELAGERVYLRGEVTSFYIKQLAQEGIRAMLPTVQIKNAIVVQARADQLIVAEAS